MKFGHGNKSAGLVNLRTSRCRGWSLASLDMGIRGLTAFLPMFNGCVCPSGRHPLCASVGSVIYQSLTAPRLAECLSREQVGHDASRKICRSVLDTCSFYRLG
jgi:hypothetical protein